MISFHVLEQFGSSYFMRRASREHHGGIFQRHDTSAKRNCLGRWPHCCSHQSMAAGAWDGLQLSGKVMDSSMALGGVLRSSHQVPWGPIAFVIMRCLAVRLTSTVADPWTHLQYIRETWEDFQSALASGPADFARYMLSTAMSLTTPSSGDEGSVSGRERDRGHSTNTHEEPEPADDRERCRQSLTSMRT